MHNRELTVFGALAALLSVVLATMVFHARSALQIGGALAPDESALSRLRTPTPSVTPTPGWWNSESTPTPSKTPKGKKGRKRKKGTPTPAPSLKGKILFVTDREGGWEEVWVMDSDGKNQHKLEIAGDNFARDKAWEKYNQEKDVQSWSPDHAYQVYVGPDAALWVFFPQQGTRWRLRAYGTAAYDPAWGPDGRIAFVSNLDGNDEIYLTNPDGKGVPPRLTRNTWEWDKWPTWSPDGRQIAFWSNRTGNKQIWVMDADGRNQRDLSQNGFDDWAPVWVRGKKKGR